MGCILSAALSPKYNIFCYFSTLYFNHINLSSPLAPLRGEIDTCAQGLFYTKYNFQQLLSQAFFHGMRIFGVSSLRAYWYIYNTSYVDCNDVTIHCPLRIEPTCLSIHLGLPSPTIILKIRNITLRSQLYGLVSIQPNCHTEKQSGFLNGLPGDMGIPLTV